MKASEAPEKLYLHPTAKGSVGASWLIFPLTDEDIEYTRTDAFIKRVWKPSDKQMKAIEHLCDGNYKVDLDILDSIYRDFKKLREE